MFRGTAIASVVFTCLFSYWRIFLLSQYIAHEGYCLAWETFFSWTCIFLGLVEAASS